MEGTFNVTPVIAETLPPGKCLELLHTRQVKRRKYIAQTTVEFALILLPFFAILFAIVDYAQIYFYKNSLQNGLREAARFATAGRIIPLTDSSGNIQYTNVNGVELPVAIDDGGGRQASRNECIRWWFLSNCVIKIPTQNITVVSAPTLEGQAPHVQLNSYGDLNLLLTNDTQPNLGPGAARDYIQITATNRIYTITPLYSYLNGYSRGGVNSYLVTVSAIVKNEPALLNFQHTNYYPDEVIYPPPQ
jgi:hypothetical protein